jgi:hypothetical protein
LVLNLPVGTTKKQAVSIKATDLKKDVSALMVQGFNGYLVVTIEGYAGIEEGVFLFKAGSLYGSIYEYVNFEITVYGDIALTQAFNATAAEFGVFDICELSKQQVDLIVAFNEKVQVSQQILQKDIQRFFPQKFDSNYAKKTLESVVKKEESKYDVFKKIGLGDISK